MRLTSYHLAPTKKALAKNDCMWSVVCTIHDDTTKHEAIFRRLTAFSTIISAKRGKTPSRSLQSSYSTFGNPFPFPPTSCFYVPKPGPKYIPALVESSRPDTGCASGSLLLSPIFAEHPAEGLPQPWGLSEASSSAYPLLLPSHPSKI